MNGDDDDASGWVSSTYFVDSLLIDLGITRTKMGQMTTTRMMKTTKMRMEMGTTTMTMMKMTMRMMIVVKVMQMVTRANETVIHHVRPIYPYRQVLTFSYLESRNIYLHPTSYSPSPRAPPNISTRLHGPSARSYRWYPHPWSSTLHGDIHVFVLLTHRISRWAYTGL
jgi:hypothetical protein